MQTERCTTFRRNSPARNSSLRSARRPPLSAAGPSCSSGRLSWRRPAACWWGEWGPPYPGSPWRCLGEPCGLFIPDSLLTKLWIVFPKGGKKSFQIAPSANQQNSFFITSSVYFYLLNQKTVKTKFSKLVSLGNGSVDNKSNTLSVKTSVIIRSDDRQPPPELAAPPSPYSSPNHWSDAASFIAYAHFTHVSVPIFRRFLPEFELKK